MKWISVKDRLPPIEEPVLLYTEGGIADGCRNKDSDYYKYTEYFICDGPACYGGCPKVTHWMPLPEPPE